MDKIFTIILVNIAALFLSSVSLVSTATKFQETVSLSVLFKLGISIVLLIAAFTFYKNGKKLLI